MDQHKCDFSPVPPTQPVTPTIIHPDHDEAERYSQDMPDHKVSEICGDENWGTVCRLSKGHEGNHSEVYSLRDTEPQCSAPESEPPARVWMLPLNPDGSSWPKKVWPEPLPCETVVYAHLEPIRKALEACENRQLSEGNLYLLHRRSDWDALVALVKESK